MLKILVWNPDRSQKQIITSFWPTEEQAKEEGKVIWKDQLKSGPVLMEINIYEPGGKKIDELSHRNF